MSILNLLKEKTADEKQNFLNSIRSKASSKLKNTDDNKILDVISIVDAFNSSLSINSLVEQSSCVPKQNIVYLQKYQVKVQIRYLYKNMILSEQKQEGVNIME